MSSKIKVDTIENVAGSGNVSLGSGHNLVVPGNITGQGTAAITGNTTVGGTLGVTGATTLANGGSAVPLSIATHVSTHELAFTGSTHANIAANNGANPFYLQSIGAGSMHFQTTSTDRMIIDASGRITKPTQPSFLATGADGNYVTTSPIPFPTVKYNIGNHYDNSTYTFTAPIAGRYFFHAHVGLLNGGSGNQGYPWFSVNGSQNQYSYQNFSTTWYGNANLTCVYNLSANDTVKVTFSYSSATYYNDTNTTKFMGFLVG